MTSTPAREQLSSNEVKELTINHTYGTWPGRRVGVRSTLWARPCYFTDSDGKKYLDFSGQLMCLPLGHQNSAVIQAIVDQAQELAYISPGYTTSVRASLSKLLLEVLPKGLNKFFFTTSGTDANEAAFKIARMATGKSKIISRYRSYHGSTAGSIAATGDPRRWAMEPAGKMPDVVFAPEVNCYKCPIGHTYPGCGIACVEYVEHMIRNESDVAAVIVEPVVGTNGVLVPPKEYMPRLREICDQQNVLLIADEVMSGWCRTGKWFAMDHWGVVPDILTTAKGITIEMARISGGSLMIMAARFLHQSFIATFL
jgi:taurine---2-oxoglutarate transaminase